jgi:hypothetical protein
MVTSERAVFDEHYFPGNKPDLLKCCPRGPASAFVDLPAAKPPVVHNDGGDDEDNSGVHRAPLVPAPNPPNTAPSPPHSPTSTRPNSPDAPTDTPQAEPAPPPVHLNLVYLGQKNDLDSVSFIIPQTERKKKLPSLSMNNQKP